MIFAGTVVVEFDGLVLRPDVALYYNNALPIVFPSFNRAQYRESRGGGETVVEKAALVVRVAATFAADHLAPPRSALCP